MRYKINDTYVTAELKDDATTASRNGRCFLVVAEMTPRDKCQNCGGVGTIGLETLEGKASDTPPGENSTFIEPDNKWFKHNIVSNYPCPVCAP